LKGAIDHPSLLDGGYYGVLTIFVSRPATFKPPPCPAALIKALKPYKPDFRSVNNAHASAPTVDGRLEDSVGNQSGRAYRTPGTHGDRAFEPPGVPASLAQNPSTTLAAAHTSTR
jgi:hypothetical protein